MKGEIRYLRGKVSFSGDGKLAPFYSVVVVFKALK